ncbi:hypothetical protein FQA39_LY16474 [Lamprigera yunnana]|nr:hypothetical protein FQA39_LY16474 [Lamprigera yunnana]
MAKRLQKNTCKQYEELLNFVEANKMLITGKTTPLESGKINILWAKCSQQINSSVFAPQKTAAHWRKVNVKRKNRSLEVQKLATGGGPNIDQIDLEERLLSLISKIHLGDTKLPKTFTAAVAPETSTNLDKSYPLFNINNEVDDIVTMGDVINLTNSTMEFVDIDGIPMSSTQSIEEVAITEQTTSRYTSKMLQSACEALKKVLSRAAAQKMQKWSALIKLQQVLTRLLLL